MSLAAAEAPTPLLLIGVPTHRRPRMLERCLESLTRLNMPEGVRVAVLVVDNDADGSAGATLAAFHDRLRLHTVVEAERGLCRVRNRMLAEARALGAHWMACLDDDEEATVDWLEVLWATQQRTGARIVSGPVARLPWGLARVPDTLEATPVRPDGSSPRRVSTNNVLFALDTLGEPPLAFDMRLNFSGGEDHEFFERVRARGGRAGWAQRAVVVEWVPAERQGLAYHWRRHYSGSVSAVRRARLLRPGVSVWIHYLGRTVGKCAGVLVALLRLPLDPQEGPRRVVARSASVAGFLGGLFGARAERYRNTDGC